MIPDIVPCELHLMKRDMVQFILGSGNYIDFQRILMTSDVSKFVECDNEFNILSWNMVGPFYLRKVVYSCIVDSIFK